MPAETTAVTAPSPATPMSPMDMRAWFEARGAGQPGYATVAELVAEHHGKSEVELDELYEAMHGSMA
jgi:hypothetical protein